MLIVKFIKPITLLPELIYYVVSKIELKNLIVRIFSGLTEWRV